MSYSRVLQYVNCIEPLTAEETLTGLSVSTFPHLKKENARRVEKRIRKATRRNLEKSNSPKTTEDIYHDLIRKLGNG